VRRPRLVLAPLTALAGLSVALGATSCGVPGHTDVVEDGAANGFVEGGYRGEEPPPGPEGTGNNVEEFVNRFLNAPAGDWDGAAKRVKQFLSPEAATSWEPREITVVRLVNGKPEIKPGPNPEVTLKVQQIGVLTNRGTLDPPTSQMDTYRFTIGGTTARGGWAVLNPPPVMLLTDAGLNRWYERQAIYFWDRGQRNLVPDLRYVPKTLDGGQRPILLIDWLIGGPSGWLKSSVQELPDGTKQLQNAYKDDGRLIVNLSSAASGQSLERLLAQLCWSLRVDFTGELVLQIESRNPREGSTSNYLDNNPTYRLSDRGAEQFAVVDGKVRRVQTEGAPATADVPVAPGVNNNVRFAAISDAYAALVRHDGDQLRLWVGPTQQQNRTGLRAPTMSRPVMADRQDTGYVAAGGKLYQFNADTAEVTEVTGLPNGVTSVALAPDGRRLAIVAGGRPHLVALSGDGGSTGDVRRLPSPLGGLTGISWLNETSLAMTGTTKGGAALVRASLDGAVISTQQEVNASAVTGLVSFPEDPVSGIGGRIMVEADGKTYQVYSSTIDYLPPETLVGKAPAKGQELTAPFFME
jgi:Lipoprotein LpqB beta-propeller domain